MFFWRGVASVSSESRNLDSDLARIEERAERCDAEQRGGLYNRAGDLCAAASDGREKLAVSYYGRAINAYVESGRYEAAAVLCRKLIRHSPEVVRAHCTLAVLALLDRRVGEAPREIESYRLAARRTRTERIAIPRLRMMAEAAEDPQARAAISDALLTLGDAEGAAQARRHPPSMEQAERTARLAHVAVLDPHELWGRAWIESAAPVDGRRHPLGELALRDDLPAASPGPGDHWRKGR